MLYFSFFSGPSPPSPSGHSDTKGIKLHTYNTTTSTAGQRKNLKNLHFLGLFFVYFIQFMHALKFQRFRRARSTVFYAVFKYVFSREHARLCSLIQTTEIGACLKCSCGTISHRCRELTDAFCPAVTCYKNSWCTGFTVFSGSEISLQIYRGN